MSKLNWILIPLFALFLSACQTQPTSLPDWITNPLQDSEYISAIGEGASLKEARMNAKQALAAQLLSHVSDELSVLSIEDGEFHRTYTERASSVKFHEIPLPATRYNQATRFDGTYFAQIQVNRQTLQAFLQTNLETLTEENKTLLSNIKSLNNPFEQWWNYETQTQNINALIDQTLIYNSYFTPKNESASELVKEFNSAYNQARNGLILAINDDTPIPGLTKALESQLNEHGILSKKVRQFSSRPELHATLKSKTERLQGDHYATSTLTLDLKSHKGQTIRSISIDAKGVSVASTSDAKQKSYEKLITQLNNENIIERLKGA
ncbi:hypothetical protein [Litoribrevibacter albus]|uniref:LPP20 lipoprotein n=1 Tax=Litoribrevibacter albus TaxID=1473156 RepID=A0AA37S9A6_9GAMM|nr:hypothetical protein [Litoribrevibacter albus]GLQ30589.1 hypothetical protein GCM10007876_10670 [Litoribrevibacter albus]